MPFVSTVAVDGGDRNLGKPVNRLNEFANFCIVCHCFNAIFIVQVLQYWYYCSVVDLFDRMPLANINVDRVLSTDEVREILVEDCYEFDSHIKQVKKRWDTLLLCDTWAKKKPVPDDRVVVTAWKEGSVFKLKPENRPCTFYPNLSFHCWLAEKPKANGLCIGDLESLVCRMEVDNIIKVLLEAGFVLKLVVYKVDVVL